MIISVCDLKFSYGDNLIFDGVNFAINEGERVGLIGANGEGKTTLINVLMGILDPDGGEVIKKNGAKIGYLEQNGGYSCGNSVYDEMKCVLREDFSAVEKLEKLSAEIAEKQPYTPEYAALSAKIDGLQKLIAARDSFNADVRIKTVLNGMGFADRYGQIIDSMSGGEKTRLKLARLLLEQPDLLILDEPTNHLDINTLFWLEDYLSSFKGAVLTVSHDRYFLDKVCARMIEIENKKVVCFAGNYSKYKVLKEERNTRLLKEYEAQCEERARLQDYVDRNIVRATTAKSALSRVNRLERMEILEKPYIPPKAPSFRFLYDQTPYEVVLSSDGFDLEIGGKSLIFGGQFEIRLGEKVALVGENGTGKSTLLKAIIGKANPLIRLGRHVNVAYFDQEGANLDKSNKVIDELWERHIGLSQTEIRSSLARCGLFEEDMQKTVGSLSGGERAKLELCILESERGNFLILDEPTNHLDLPARESLEKALKQFDGTILFVSHDRYFLSALADRVFEIENQKLNCYDAGYEEFAEEKKRKKDFERAEREREELAARKEQKSASYRSAKQRAEDAKKKERIKKIEAEISLNEDRQSLLESSLSDPEVTADYKRVSEIAKELDEIKNRLDELYAEYEKLI